MNGMGSERIWLEGKLNMATKQAYRKNSADRKVEGSGGGRRGMLGVPRYWTTDPEVVSSRHAAS